MLSLSPSPSNLRCSTQIAGLKTSAGVPSSLPKRLRFRPTVAAASAAAERSSSSCLCPPRPASSSCGSLYEVLGIPVGATVTEIKSAYRRLARICHPDVAGDDRKEISAGDFMEIHAAYSTLSDPEKRADYDRKLSRRLRPYGSFSGISSYPAAMSGFGGYGGRSWETDQCW